jgi:hypothetical protein
MRRRVAAFLTIVLLVSVLALPSSAARADEAALGCASKVEIPIGDFTQPPNLDLAIARLKKELLYYRCTSYDADIAKVLDEASAWVKARAPEVVAAGKAPAIVLDIDETSLSNWIRIYRDNFDYVRAGPCDLNDNTKPCGDLAWQSSGKAPAIGPTRDLYKLARCIEAALPCKPIDVFFITGRRENGTPVDGKTPRQWTRDNLIAAGYADVADDHLFLRGDVDNGVQDYKSTKRAEIETKLHMQIIANIGDQQSDLDGGHAERPFKLPNPFYFIPAR